MLDLFFLYDTKFLITSCAHTTSELSETKREFSVIARVTDPYLSEEPDLDPVEP